MDNQDDTEYMYEARVNIKRFLYLLGSQIQSNKVICSKFFLYLVQSDVNDRILVMQTLYMERVFKYSCFMKMYLLCIIYRP